VIKELEQREEKAGALPLLLVFYLRLLKVQAGAEQEIRVPEPLLSDAVANKRLERGKPLLRFKELKLDFGLLQKTFGEISQIFADYPELFEMDQEFIRQLDASSVIGPETLRAWFEKNAIPQEVVPSGISQPLLENIILATLKPYLVSYQEALIGIVRQEYWRHRHCPVCGGVPDFTYLERERGSRWLVCSRCDAEWLFQRLECPYCGNLDQKTLAFFTDESGLYRLYVCEKCQQYLKCIDVRKTQSEVRLPLERLETLDLDRQAQEQGYRPGRPQTVRRKS
jgi:FdhE protein